MKHEIGITITGIITSLIIVILVTQGGFFLSGHAAFSEDELNQKKIFTREDAIATLNESQKIIDEMTAANFSGVLVKDLLAEAKRTFQQVEYAEILRGNMNATSSEKIYAANALLLINWQSSNYSDILTHTKEIEEIRDLAFFVQDILSVQESLLGAQKNEAGEIVSFTEIEEVHLERFKFLINEVQKAIDESRYAEAQILAEELSEEIDIRRTEVFTALVITEKIRDKLIEYWYISLLVLITAISGTYHSLKKIKKRKLKKNIHRLKTQRIVLRNLMRKAQTQRFKQNKISENIYKIRMKKYEEKLNNIKQTLPILIKNLNKNKKKSTKKIAEIEKLKNPPKNTQKALRIK